MVKEIKSLTGIRGIAALWVVLLHFVYVTKFHTDNQFLDAGNQFLKKGNLGVDMFFMLSAFVMCLAYQNVFNNTIVFKDIKVFYIKPFIRIYPAYIFWLLTTALLYKKLSLQVIGINMLLSQNFFNPDKFIVAEIFWSLSAEWWMYMIFPFVFYVLNKFISTKLFHVISLLIISFVGLYVISSLNIFYIGSDGIAIKKYDYQFSVIFGINSIVRCLFCYFIGIALFFLLRDEKIRFEKVLRPISIYVICMVILILSFFKNTEIYIVVFLALLILALYINRTFENFFSSRIVYFLGLISYSLYLIHTTLRFVITVIVMKLFHVPVTSADFPSMLISLLALVPISYVSYIYIEKQSGSWLKTNIFNKELY